MQNHLQEYLEKCWMQPITSPYNHPILFMLKKSGELSVYIDHKSLNSNAIINRYL